MILFIIAPNGFASASFDDSKNFKYLNKFPFPPNIYIYIFDENLIIQIVK